jgi:hypothetical protein
MGDGRLLPALDRLLERFAAGEAVRRPTVAHPDCTCGKVRCEACGRLTYGEATAWSGREHKDCGGRLAATTACTLEH